MEIKIVNKSNNPLPIYQSDWASGMDLRCNIEEDVVLAPMERHLFPTGLYIELPQGYEAQIRPRSGLAAKQGITVLNSPGTIDADYRGEICVLLINLSNEQQTIYKGERICQMVINKVELATLIETNSLSETKRNEGGYGSTGIF